MTPPCVLALLAGMLQAHDMERYSPDDLSPFEIGIFLNTNDTVSSGAFGTLLFEIERIAQDERFLGPTAELRITELGLGSVKGKLTVFFAGVAATATTWAAVSTHRSANAAVEMAEMQKEVAARASRSNSYLGQCLAEMHLDSSVVSLDVTTASGNRFIKTSSLPAVDYVERKRALYARSQLRDPDMVDIPLHGSVNDRDQVIDELQAAPISKKDRIPLAMGPDMVLGDGQGNVIGVDAKQTGEQETVPTKRNGQWLFDASTDRRGAKALIGKFAKRGDDMIYFYSETGPRFGAIFDEEIPLPESFPTPDRVMVRATVDSAHKTIYVIEIYQIDEP